MYILLGIVCALCAVLGIRAHAAGRELRSLYLQLKEIEQGSHIELAMLTKNRRLSALCRLMNEILASKDKEQIQYTKAEKSLKQNITGLAHDIRTPLTGASGYVQLAKECQDEAKKEHYLECAEERMKELEDMLEELFLYTKLTSEDFTLSENRLQVLPILEECLFALYSRFEKLRLSPEVAFEAEGFTIWGDEEALHRVFLNLLQNALIHGDGGIRITQKKDQLIFENIVSEDSLPNLAQMFDRFYKGNQARRKGSSGLGLFVVKELVQKMGGRVWAEAEKEASLTRLRILLEFPQEHEIRHEILHQDVIKACHLSKYEI